VYAAKKITTHVHYRFLKNILIAFFLASYFISMEQIGAGCLGTKTGYPFLHPLLPLIHLKQNNQSRSSTYHFIKLRPANKTIESLFHHLEKKSKKKRNAIKQNIFVTPELAVTIDLNAHQDRMQHCIALLQTNDILIVSGLKIENENIYHQLYFYTSNGLQGYINKKNLIPLYEYIPARLSKIPWLKDIFLKNKDAFSPYQNNQSKNIIINNQHIEGNICSDFFTQKNTTDPETRLHIIVANDEPMAPYIATLMMRYVTLKQQKNQLPTFYVGWRNNLKIF
jgi:apolipoprotein N-acyltransferase